MEYLCIILFILSLVQLIVQYSLIEKRMYLILLIGIIGIGVYFMHYKAIEQSYTRLEGHITNQSLLVNLVVLQVIEAILGTLLSISLIRQEMGEKVKKWISTLKYVPGIILFFAMFYGESYLFLLIRTNSFSCLGLGIAACTGLLLVLLVSGFKWLIHEFDLRCEIKFLLHIVQIVMAAALYISLTRLPVNEMTEYGSLLNFGVIASLFLVTSVIGYFIFNYKMKKLFKR